MSLNRLNLTAQRVHALSTVGDSMCGVGNQASLMTAGEFLVVHDQVCFSSSASSYTSEEIEAANAAGREPVSVDPTGAPFLIEGAVNKDAQESMKCAEHGDPDACRQFF